MRQEEDSQEAVIRKAKQKAMRLLAQMDRSERNLRQKLAQNGFPPKAVDAAVDYVKSYGYVDDGRYARNYLAYRLQMKSRQKLFQELYQKGVSKEIIEEAWAEVSADESPDERSLIRRQVLKKYEPGSRLDVGQMRRLYGFLARKGFRYDDIRSVLEEEDICQSDGLEN